MPTTISDAALNAALDVLTGIELEFDIFDARMSDLECHCEECAAEAGSEQFTYQNYGLLGGGVPSGWEPGTDEAAECRSDGPTALRAQYDLLARFVDWVEGAFDDIDMGVGHSCHVHVNVSPHVGPAVSVQHITDAWFEMRDEAYTLVAHDGRLQSAWCKPLHSGDQLWESKWRELVLNSVGSVELRLFDATTDVDLLHRRMDFVQRWVACALQREWAAAAYDAAKRAAAVAVHSMT